VLMLCLLSRSLTVVTRRKWSKETSAPFIARTSRYDLLDFWLVQVQSIWFTMTWSGDLQVTLRMQLCGKMFPPITMWFRVHMCAKLSPFLFIYPNPWVPMIYS
jgi:hypothetical protein